LTGIARSTTLIALLLFAGVCWGYEDPNIASTAPNNDAGLLVGQWKLNSLTVGNGTLSGTLLPEVTYNFNPGGVGTIVDANGTEQFHWSVDGFRLTLKRTSGDETALFNVNRMFLILVYNAVTKPDGLDSNIIMKFERK